MDSTKIALSQTHLKKTIIKYNQRRDDDGINEIYNV